MAEKVKMLNFLDTKISGKKAQTAEKVKWQKVSFGRIFNGRKTNGQIVYGQSTARRLANAF